MADLSHEDASFRFLVCAGVLLLAAFVLAGRSLESPGLYYDEAVQARPAKEFVSGAVYATTFPGSRSISVAGRPFPLMTQPYMGALKSQALIPSVWLFGSDTGVLRMTTLLWALVGVGFIASFARRAFGEGTALIVTLLLAFDPSLLLLARHDWGSFAISLLLRGAAFWFCWRWWETRRLQLLFAGFMALGLGLYNKVDFAIFLAGAVVGVAACGAAPLMRALRERPAAIATAAVGLSVGLAPMLPGLATVFAARSAFATPGESDEKLRTLWTMLDGSYFHRLMEVGGLFDRMQEAEAGPTGLLGLAFVAAFALAPVLLCAKSLLPAKGLRESKGGRRREGIFVVASASAAVLAFLALPGGVRIHHSLNIYPYPQLLVAWVLSRLAANGRAARLSSALAAGLIAVSGVIVFAQAIELTDRSGGRGRWSDSIQEFARDLDSRSESIVVSLDWGFHETLGFLTEGPRLIDAYPRITASVQRTGMWTIDGGTEHVYLLHSGKYDLFGYGTSFLRAIRELGDEVARVRRHTDREGELAFLSVEFTRGHRITYRPGGFRVRVERLRRADR